MMAVRIAGMILSVAVLIIAIVVSGLNYRIHKLEEENMYLAQKCGEALQLVRTENRSTIDATSKMIRATEDLILKTKRVIAAADALTEADKELTELVRSKLKEGEDDGR